MATKIKKTRRNSTTEDRVTLLTEVNRVCPLCGKDLITTKNNRTLYAFEIAHIYPHKPNKHELELLKDVKRLSTDSEDLENLILLCPSCHSNHDKYTQLEEYYRLYDLKSKMIAETTCRSFFGDYRIETQITDVINSLSKAMEDKKGKLPKLDYDVFTIDEKSDETLNVFTESMIKSFVRSYFITIREQFEELDKSKEGSFDLIASQIRTFYIQLKNNEKDKTIIFEQICEWIYIKVGRENKVGCQVLASFFVQNCEVLK
ncbi:HNH endonuclease [Acidaminobacter sp. JC074]|uniref:ABC-three component system protein n=1 Tax=Acidaminobacter sp. JC074 TaxID=2530199 RepID=UPI001F10E3C5|nr:ABC-three component system protein [Acidaminobacter sp. JC074]MCH4891215.1 HNH endonuclease [Acidaminobacter sp. JC074]